MTNATYTQTTRTQGSGSHLFGSDDTLSHDDASDLTVNRNLPETPGDTPTSIAGSAMLSQEAVHMSDQLLAGAKNVIVAGILGLGGMVFVFSWICAAVLSRLE